MSEEIRVEKEEDTGGTKRIEFDAPQRESIIKISQIVRKILDADNGNYIISCLDDAVGNKPSIIRLNNLINALQYNYANEVLNFILAVLVNPPFYTQELKNVIKDDTVNDFIDEIRRNYGSDIIKIYKCRIGDKDWQYIRSNPIIREDGIAIDNNIVLVNEETINFTSSLKSLPKLTSHFLKHINRTIDFLKERAILEISMSDIELINAQMKELLQRIESFEKTKEQEKEKAELKSE